MPRPRAPKSRKQRSGQKRRPAGAGDDDIFSPLDPINNADADEDVDIDGAPLRFTADDLLGEMGPGSVGRLSLSPPPTPRLSPPRLAPERSSSNPRSDQSVRSIRTVSDDDEETETDTDNDQPEPEEKESEAQPQRRAAIRPARHESEDPSWSPNLPDLRDGDPNAEGAPSVDEVEEGIKKLSLQPTRDPRNLHLFSESDLRRLGPKNNPYQADTEAERVKEVGGITPIKWAPPRMKERIARDIRIYESQAYVARSTIPNAGLGVFCRIMIPKGKFIMEYKGDLFFEKDINLLYGEKMTSTYVLQLNTKDRKLADLTKNLPVFLDPTVPKKETFNLAMFVNDAKGKTRKNPDREVFGKDEKQKVPAIPVMSAIEWNRNRRQKAVEEKNRTENKERKERKEEKKRSGQNRSAGTTRRRSTTQNGGHQQKEEERSTMLKQAERRFGGSRCLRAFSTLYGGANNESNMDAKHANPPSLSREDKEREAEENEDAPHGKFLGTDFDLRENYTRAKNVVRSDEDRRRGRQRRQNNVAFVELNGRVFLKSLVDIPENTELFLSYGSTYWAEEPTVQEERALLDVLIENYVVFDVFQNLNGQIMTMPDLQERLRWNKDRLEACVERLVEQKLVSVRHVAEATNDDRKCPNGVNRNPSKCTRSTLFVSKPLNGEPYNAVRLQIPLWKNIHNPSEVDRKRPLAHTTRSNKSKKSTVFLTRLIRVKQWEHWYRFWFLGSNSRNS